MTLTSKQKTTLTKNYLLTMNMDKALDNFEDIFGFRVSEMTVYNCIKPLRGNVLPQYFHGGKRKGFSLEEFETFYEECNGSMAKMIEKSGYKRHSLQSLCRKCEKKTNK